jgi:hypothetical protein
MAEKRGPDPDELLKKLQRREEKRSFRPIKLYETAYEQEEDRLFVTTQGHQIGDHALVQSR